MEIIDISLPIRPNMTIYEGDPAFEMRSVTVRDPNNPNSWNTSQLIIGTHTGTHVDSPRHFDNEGAGTDALCLQTLCGPARVVDMRGSGKRIDANHLSELELKGTTRLLLRTDNSDQHERPFDRDYVHLTEEACHWLLAMGMDLIGIDSPSVEAFDSPGMPVHHALLGGERQVVVVEGLDLRRAEAGDYQLFCLPLKLVDGDGAPARAVLVR